MAQSGPMKTERGLTELKRHNIKLGRVGQMEKSDELLLPPTGNGNESLRSQSDCQR